MKNRLQLVPSFIILAYAGILISGRTFHQHLCNVSDTDCCERVETNAHHASFKANSSGCPLQSSTDITVNTSPDNGTTPDDGLSDCWTCYTLSQAGNSSAELFLSAHHQVVFFFCSDYENRRLQACTHNYLVRGPPEIHSATS